MRYFIIIFALFIATISIAQPGGRLIRIKVGKGEPGSTGLTGPAGADGTMGTDGREVEMQNNGTYIQWRYVGDVSWTNLIAISTLEGTDGTDGVDGIDGIMGADGKEIELQNSGTYIQWRYVGDVSWINLISIAAITGADGTDGVDGMDGSIWHDGTGIPSGGLGSNGDYYLNNTNGDVYNKIAGTWTYVTNIKGTDGIGAGTVTIVTGSAPVVITSVPTATPNVTVDTTSNIGLFTQYDGSLKQDRILGTAGQTLRLSATNTVSASSFLYNNGSSIGINNTSPTGSLTVDGASYFNSQLPFNLYNSAGTGIYTSFQDGAYLDNLVYSGLRKTFTLGYASGGGLSISDNSLYKKLHVNGGVSIGEGIYNGTIAQNSLVVEGSATVQTRTGTATTLSGYDINGKFCTPSLGSGLTITGGALTYTNNAIQNLNGQTGTTQSFSYAATGTYPSWLSSGDVHTFRFPGGSAGQLIFHNGTGWTAGTPDYMSSWLLAASGTGGTEAITNGETFTINAGSGISANRSGNIVTITNTGDGSSSNELQTLSTTGAAGNITISSGNTITLNVNDADASTTNELQTVSNTSNSTSHTVTLSNSGGSTQFVEDTGISFTTSGTGLNGIVAIKNEGDLLVTNEGSLTVAAGASNTSIINSNTTGSTGVTIKAGTGMTISETGNEITLNSTATGTVTGVTALLPLITTGTTAPVVSLQVGTYADIEVSGNPSFPTQTTVWNVVPNAITSGKILDNTVGNADLRQGAGKSVIGVTGNSTTNVGDIVATAASQVLRVNAANNVLDFGQVATGGIENNAVTYGKMQTVTASRLLGNDASGSAVEEISLGSGLAFSGATLNTNTIYAEIYRSTSETFNLTANVNRFFDMDGSSADIGNIDVNSPSFDYIDINDNGKYEITISGSFESASGSGVYYINVRDVSNLISECVILKSPTGIVPFSYTFSADLVSTQNIGLNIKSTSNQTGDIMHYGRIKARKIN